MLSEAMTDFLERPILNSPYEYPGRHWELDESGQPTGREIDEGKGISTEVQEYDPTSHNINELRARVDAWRALCGPNDWLVTPETARLPQRWWHHPFSDIRPFCQVEAIEPLICTADARVTDCDHGFWLSYGARDRPTPTTHDRPESNFP